MAATFSESTPACIGICTTASAAASQGVLSPWPSVPSSSASRSVGATPAANSASDTAPGVSANAATAHQVALAVRRVTARPLIVKLTPNVTSISEIGLAVQEAGADAVSAINTLVGMSVDIHTRRPRLASVTGGLSGPAIKPVALAKVYELVRSLRIPVIAIGGIFTAEDALEFLIVGARAVQIGTASFVHPDAALQVIQGLEKYCAEHNTSAADLCGTLALR